MTNLLDNAGQKPVCLMVLGPHRCGTSALSGVLSHLGVDLPASLMPPNENNAVGYFESLRVMAFNDKLLDALGSDWKDISPVDLGEIPTQVLESLMSEAVKILDEEFSTARLPLLKDPRICRCVGFWTEAFIRAGYQPLYIHTHRNPLEMADSIEKRDAIPVEIGLLIWLRHVLDAEAATRGKMRVFTNYKALLDNWRTQISQMEEVLGMTFRCNTANFHQDIDDFLSDTLRHQHRAPEEVRKSAQVADVVREAFQIFESWAGSAGNPLDYDTLNALRHRLDSSLDLINIFVRTQNKWKAANAAKLAELEGALRQQSLEAEATLRENDQLTQAIEALQAEKTKLVDEHEEDLTSLQESLRTRDNNLRNLERSVIERNEEIALISRTLLAVTEREAANAAKLAEFEGALRQRSLEAEATLRENDQLTQAIEALQAEKTKLVDEHEEDLTSLQESLRTRDNDLRNLERSVNERFEEIALVSKILLAVSEREAAYAAKVAELEGALRQRSLEAEEKLRENGQLTQALVAFQSGTLWKITGAFRWFGALFR